MAADDVTEGYPAGGPAVQRALSAFGEGEDGEDVLRWPWSRSAAPVTCATTQLGYVYTRHLQHARDAGGLTELPVTLARDDMRQRRRLGP